MGVRMTGSLNEEPLELEETAENDREQNVSLSDNSISGLEVVADEQDETAFYSEVSAGEGALDSADLLTEVKPDDILPNDIDPAQLTTEPEDNVNNVDNNRQGHMDPLEGAPATNPGDMASPAKADSSGDAPSQAVVPADDRAMAPTDILIPPIPRISVHAFCNSDETFKTLDKIRGDRRMSKAQTKVEMGGIKAAVAYFSESPTPNLVIVEMEADADTLFNQLSALANVCDPGTKVVVVGNCNDIRIYRSLIREGISEYLVTPFTPVQILETIGSLYIDPEAAPAGRVVAFIGAKGGAGSSTIAHNIAWTLSDKFEEEATIVDLDLPFGTACLNFNEDPTQGVVDALVAPERVDDVLLDRLLIRHGPNLNIFSSPSSLDRDYDMAPHAFETVLDVVRKSVANVIVDVPNVWTNWSKMVLLTADQIVIVATPDLASLRNVMNLYEVFKQARPNDPLPLLVLNKTGLSKKVEITERDFTEALQKEPSLIIPFDGELFGSASNNGQMISEVDKRGEISDKLMTLSQMITGRETRTKKKSSLLNLLSFQKSSKREKRSA